MIPVICRVSELLICNDGSKGSGAERSPMSPSVELCNTKTTQSKSVSTISGALKIPMSKITILQQEYCVPQTAGCELTVEQKVKRKSKQGSNFPPGPRSPEVSVPVADLVAHLVAFELRRLAQIKLDRDFKVWGPIFHSGEDGRYRPCNDGGCFQSL
jgi:hypothetical protein